MSSWDTNPWSNFCNPYWELAGHNKWHKGTSEISTPLKIATEIHFHASHALKLPHYLSLLTEKPLGLLLSLVSLLSGGTMQPENIYSCILMVTGQVWESQKRIRIKTTHNYYQCFLTKPISTDLTKKSDSVLTNPNSEGGCAAFKFFIKLKHKVILSTFTNWFLLKALFIIHITQITLEHGIMALRHCNENQVSGSNPTRCLARLRVPTSLQGSQWPWGQNCRKPRGSHKVSEAGSSISCQSWSLVSQIAVKKTNYCRTDIFKYSFFLSTIFEWNQLDDSLHNSKSYSIFKNSLLNISRSVSKSIFNINNSF